ncbi:MAG TPA: hypothetical protein PKE27_15550 [Povalibacter sp.]|uniref:hypothetical protein n=1 Tax=Povalibacter sp. TaxID=1962978 RepID=UPI002CE066C0|nr:hypothetical protein [Povalibacter sp.]HMN45992.1 hypothetical protein [Povalibacter sp.]
MKSATSSRSGRRSPAGLLAVAWSLAAIPFAPAGAQAPAKAPDKPWVVPRTFDGKPDLQGNWSNETQTPFERMGNQGPTLTDEQAAALEKRAHDVEEFRDRPTEPGEVAVKGGSNELADVPGEPTFVERLAQAAGGVVGGYNGFWLDPGHRVIRIDGVARSSIIVDPANGRLPPLTAAARQRTSERMALAKQSGEFDGPEVRSLSDRCITSFGSNAGPPMLPNYFYNNNYTIVQTKDHVLIMTEMIHDARIIRLGATQHAPAQVRPWFGDSIGHWEGDTLVVETTNIHPTQLAQASPLGPYRGASDQLKVTERFTRTGPDVILYRFTVEDPATFTAPYTGELPFNRIDEPIYEYACHEGNYALPGILAGAREEERARTEQKKP